MKVHPQLLMLNSWCTTSTTSRSSSFFTSNCATERFLQCPHYRNSEKFKFTTMFLYYYRMQNFFTSFKAFFDRKGVPWSKGSSSIAFNAALTISDSAINVYHVNVSSIEQIFHGRCQSSNSNIYGHTLSKPKITCDSLCLTFLNNNKNNKNNNNKIPNISLFKKRL